MAGWQTLIVRSDARLVIESSNLHLERADGSWTLPIEDLDAVLIESPGGSISVPALSALAQRAIALMVVDEKHTPCGILLPYSQNPHGPSLLQAQIASTEPFKKRIWQKIIKQKIENSAACLETLDKPGAAKLKEIAGSVLSGDTTGREAYAARTYFHHLDPSFRRRSDDPISAALDYGYAIIRAAIARSLAATGLQCALGVGHRNAVNDFNLADDMIEPFRSFVDLLVFRRPPSSSGFDAEYRAYLFRALQLECLIGPAVYSISTAAWKVAHSYARAVLARDHRELALPQLTGFNLREHE